MPVKKTTAKKTTAEKATFEKKMWDAKVSVVETAEKVWEKSREVAWEIGGRWVKADTAEKVCTCLGIVLILVGLFAFESVRKLIIPLILIIIWVLLVTWFFSASKK